METTGIKSMKLYGQVERIYNDLKAAGFSDDDPLSVGDLSPFDQYHYFGTKAVDDAAKRLAIGTDSRVLEVGSGIGGPSRHLAERTGCQITALELQPDLDDVARSLTGRCGLAERVEHVCGDVLAHPLPAESYDAVVSWLALYHVPDQTALFARCADTLKPGGALYAEDLYERAPLTDDERNRVAHELYGAGLTTRENYCDTLQTTGFEEITFEDVSELWATHVAERLKRYRAGFERHVAVHGEDVAAALDHFYDIMNAMFVGGHLGGVRIVARKA
jgi:cyclopropane fatty-acyl-phospholipid synthase-like methyltransferase